jgi:hypothetical protein
VGGEGLEPSTSSLSATRSNQLSYPPTSRKILGDFAKISKQCQKDF